jgi:hypothetical protein
MKRMMNLACLTALAPVWLAAANAQQDPQRESALAQISKATDDICQTVQQRGRKSEAQVTGEIEAKLPQALAKIVDVGGKGTGQISKSEYEGLSQETVSTALQSNMNCRQNVSIKLIERLLPGAPSVEPNQQQRAYNPASPYATTMPESPAQQDVHAMVNAGRNEEACRQRMDRKACHDLYLYSSQQCAKGDQQSCHAVHLLEAMGLR